MTSSFSYFSLDKYIILPWLIGILLSWIYYSRVCR
jgi:hypothetical protein